MECPPRGWPVLVRWLLSGNLPLSSTLSRSASVVREAYCARISTSSVNKYYSLTRQTMSTTQERPNCKQYFVKTARFIILFVLCVQLNGINGQGRVGDSCSLPNGGQGRCQDQILCPALLTGSDEDQELCSYRGNKRIVCCDIYNQPPRRGSNTQIEYISVDENESNSDPPWWNQPGNNRPFSQPSSETPWWMTTERTTRRHEERPVWQVDNNQEYATRPTTRATTRRTPRPTRPTRPTSKPTRATPRPVRPVAPNDSITNRISKAEQMCDVYAKLVRQQVTALALTPIAEPVHHQIEKCDFNGLPLIVGGTKSRQGEFPHMAAIGYRDSNTRKIVYDCGGSLISEFFVMTAAHCCTTRLPVQVRLGALNIAAENESSRPVNYRVIEILRHPEHKVTARYNDIALLRLAEKVTFSKFIRPACLNTRDPVEGKKAIAIGWGKIDFAEEKSDLLLKVHIDLIDTKTCNELYNYDRKASGKLRDGIVPSMLCAGDLKGGKDTCQGDSGGPLQVSSSKNQCLYYIVGITSFGKFCAAENSPGVYTRVSYYVPWIQSIVWP